MAGRRTVVRAVLESDRAGSGGEMALRGWQPEDDLGAVLLAGPQTRRYTYTTSPCRIYFRDLPDVSRRFLSLDYLKESRLLL